MGAYNHAIITTAGQSLSAQAIALGKDLTFTNVQASSHVYPAGTSLEALTSLQDVEQTEQISSAVVTNSTQIKVSARLTNEQVSTGYAINTIGILAKLDGDQTDTLFAVITAISADTMPAYSAANPVALIYDVTLAISNADNITVVVSPTGTASVADLQNVANGVRDTAAHNLAPEYDATADYAVGDYCTYAGVLYRCNTAITGGETWTSGHWTQTDVESEFATDADLTASFNTAAHNLAAEYDSTSTYAVGDYCTHGGTLYMCSTAINTAEAWDATHWTQTTVEAAIADGDKFFLITITGIPVFPPITADKTWSEVETAGLAGKVLLVKYGAYYYLASRYAPITGSGGVVTIMCPPFGSMGGIQNDAIEFCTFTWGSTGYSVTVSDSFYDIAGMAHSLAAEHNTTTSYNVGDYVTRNGVLYKCTTATSGTFLDMFWTAVTVTDEMGGGGSGGAGLTFIPLIYGETDDGEEEEEEEEEEEPGASGYYLDTDTMSEADCITLLATSESIAVSVDMGGTGTDVRVYQYAGNVTSADTVYNFARYADGEISVITLIVSGGELTIVESHYSVVNNTLVIPVSYDDIDGYAFANVGDGDVVTAAISNGIFVVLHDTYYNRYYTFNCIDSDGYYRFVCFDRDNTYSTILYHELKMSGVSIAGDEYILAKASDIESQVLDMMLNLAPIYSTALTYSVGDVVINFELGYGYKLYKCTTAVTTPEPFDGTKWMRTTVADLL